MSHPIRLGTVVANRGHDTAAALRSLVPHGFESFEIAFKNTLAGTDLERLADEVAQALEGTGAIVSCLGIYGNTLAEDPHGDEVRATLRQMIPLAQRFGTNLVACFTGRVTGASIPDSIPRFRQVFMEMATLAEEAGVRIAFENCLQGGNWLTGDRNMAHNPAAWELLFDAVPSPALGLEWEPAHQLCQLIDPLPQLREWAPRIFHVHGKDGELRPEVLARAGIFGAERFVYHRFPGLGDSNWARIVSALLSKGYRGSIDIEGGHDPVYREELDLQGQLLALGHLRAARGPVA